MAIFSTHFNTVILKKCKRTTEGSDLVLLTQITLKKNLLTKNVGHLFIQIRAELMMFGAPVKEVRLMKRKDTGENYQGFTFTISQSTSVKAALKYIQYFF